MAEGRKKGGRGVAGGRGVSAARKGWEDAAGGGTWPLAGGRWVGGRGPLGAVGGGCRGKFLKGPRLRAGSATQPAPGPLCAAAAREPRLQPPPQADARHTRQATVWTAGGTRQPTRPTGRPTDLRVQRVHGERGVGVRVPPRAVHARVVDGQHLDEPQPAPAASRAAGREGREGASSSSQGNAANPNPTAAKVQAAAHGRATPSSRASQQGMGGG